MISARRGMPPPTSEPSRSSEAPRPAPRLHQHQESKSILPPGSQSTLPPPQPITPFGFQSGASGIISPSNTRAFRNGIFLSWLG